jgi:hypothetical protein
MFKAMLLSRMIFTPLLFQNGKDLDAAPAPRLESAPYANHRVFCFVFIAQYRSNNGL